MQFVAKQLTSSCVMSYAEFIRCGYPIHLDVGSLNGIFQPYFEQFRRFCPNEEHFYRLLAISIGSLPDDFKFGENVIFFRQNKSPHFVDLLELNPQSTSSIIVKMQSFLEIAEKWQRMGTSLYRLFLTSSVFCSLI